MVYQWEPDTYYGPGSVVLFEGVQYQIVQPHTSEANWTPPATPALWVRVAQEVQVNQPPPPPNYGSQQSWDTKQQEMPLPPSTGNGGYQSGEVQIPVEEQKKHWYDLDEERKKQLMVGGGLAAGAALLGAGFLAYKNHKNKSEDEKNAMTWSLQNWVHEAKERRHNYEKHGLGNQPYAWVLNKGHDIPQGAIVGGQQNGEPMYICRAFFEGGLHIGKVGRSFQKGGCIGFANEEIHVESYEILVGDMRALQWIRVSGSLNVSALGRRPIEGGRESDGTALYVAQGFLQDGPHPGKAGTHLNGANIPYNGHEEFTAEYLVLCWN